MKKSGMNTEDIEDIEHQRRCEKCADCGDERYYHEGGVCCATIYGFQCGCDGFTKTRTPSQRPSGGRCYD